MIDGRVTVGPNAVLGFSREGYGKRSVRLGDVWSMARSRGFWKMARQNLRSGVTEFRNSLSRSRYLEQLHKYCPSLTRADLPQPGAALPPHLVARDAPRVPPFLPLPLPPNPHLF